jgi:hypothetical protein
MELVFRMALILLVEANERLVVADPSGGRDRQYTILEVPRVLEDDLLRGRLLAAMPDPQIRAMWRTYFTPLDHRFRLEIINPVQTKVYKFAANVVARSIVGQSRSTIDPQAWVRDGAIVVVDVAKEQVGADIAAMLGRTLVNLVAIALGQQAALPTDQRRHVALLVDEFHALPAANYEAFWLSWRSTAPPWCWPPRVWAPWTPSTHNGDCGTRSSRMWTTCSHSTARPKTRARWRWSWAHRLSRRTSWSSATTSVMPALARVVNDCRLSTCCWTRLQSQTRWSATWWPPPPALGADGTPRS